MARNTKIWSIKQNWHFTYYHRFKQEDEDDIIGHIIVQGDDVHKLLEQLEDTEIWSTADASDADED